MKKPTNEYTDDEIMKRLAFAQKIKAAKRGEPISDTLERERRELLCEMEVRTSLVTSTEREGK